ncbi:MAG: DUF1385 domain-containing protein [Lachnospiraceae bacterium]|nr:DUF1385 domain-containing protein [Lachnospiraceae bacterium]
MSEKKKRCQCFSGIGGQAVIEGVMMRNGDKYAVAVRKPDQEIEVDIQDFKSVNGGVSLFKLPFIRGIFSFIDSLVIGMKIIMYSAEFLEEDEPKGSGVPETSTEGATVTASKKAADEKAEKKSDTIVMTLTLVVSLLFSIGLFMVLPTFLASLVDQWIPNPFLLSLFEGLIRVIIFLAYISLISLSKDIKRTYMYHGAEHKCINCIESGKPLTLENVRNTSRFHKRCGTSFLFLVMLISILIFMCVRTDILWLRILSRVILVPVVAGISFEVLQFCGRHDNLFVDIVSAPGVWLQRITTKEPDDDMIEVGIASVEAVFDWEEYLRVNFPEKPPLPEGDVYEPQPKRKTPKEPAAVEEPPKPKRKKFEHGDRKGFTDLTEPKDYEDDDEEDEEGYVNRGTADRKGFTNLSEG